MVGKKESWHGSQIPQPSTCFYGRCSSQVLDGHGQAQSSPLPIIFELEIICHIHSLWDMPQHMCKKNTEANVFFRDSIALRDSYESFSQYVRNIRPEYFFIESATPSWEHDKKVIRKLSKLYPNMKIVVTGPIASKAKELLENNPIHAVIHGEYEKGAC